MFHIIVYIAFDFGLTNYVEKNNESVCIKKKTIFRSATECFHGRIKKLIYPKCYGAEILTMSLVYKARSVWK